MKNTTTSEYSSSNDTGKKVEDVIDSGKKYVEDFSSEYSKKLKDGLHVAKEKAQVASTEINQWVQKRPLMALGIALGAGIVLGRVFVTATRRE